MKKKNRKMKSKKVPHIENIKFVAGAGSVSIIAAAQAEDGETQEPKKIEMLAYTGGVMAVSYYGDVVIDLAGMEIPSGAIPLFRDHDPERIIGHGTATIKDGQLIVAGIASVDNDLSREFIQSSETGFPWQASLGANPVVGGIDELEKGDTIKVNGQEVAGPAMIIRKSKLKEVSAVPLGADSNTVSKVAACFVNCTEENIMSYEAWLKAGGWDVENLSDEQMKTLKATFEAEGNEPEVKKVAEGNEPEVKKVVAAAPVVDVDGAIKAERVRVAEITAACDTEGLDEESAVKMSEVKASALADGDDLASVQASALKIVRASRATSTFAINSGKSDLGNKGIEAAILMQAGHTDTDLGKSYKDEDLEAGYKNRGLGIKDLMRICCSNEGIAVPMAFGNGTETIRAAFTTTSLSGILSNVLGKELLAGYESVENVSSKLSGTRSVNNFQQVSSYRVVSEGKWEVVAPSGKITHGEIAENSYTNQAKTYGEIITLNRQMIINDDLGALTSLASGMGRGYALTKEQIFWGVVKANANSLYSGDNSNLNTSNGFDAAGLVAAVLAMETLTDVKSNPINVQAKSIVVPSALKFTAQQLIGSAQLMATGDTDTTNIPMSNPFNNRYEVISSPYLDSSIGGAGSATTWYLFADPAAVASYEFAYLNGVSEPTIQTADTDFDTLGMSWRGYGDFGLGEQDPNGSAKNTA